MSPRSAQAVSDPVMASYGQDARDTSAIMVLVLVDPRGLGEGECGSSVCLHFMMVDMEGQEFHDPCMIQCIRNLWERQPGLA